MDRCSLLITAKWPVPCWHEIQFILEHLWPTAVIKKVAFLYLHNVKILLWNGWVWSYKIGFMNDVDPHMIWFHQSMFLHLYHLYPLLWRFTYIWIKVLMISRVTLVVLSVHFNSISVFQFDFTCTEVLVCYHILLKLGPWTKWQNLGTCWAIFSSFSQKKRGGKRLCVFLTVKLEKGFCQLKLMSNWFNFVCLFLQLHKDKVSTVVAWEAAA